MSTEEFYSHELIDWAKSVEFYLEETAIFEERIETVIKGYSKPDILATIEHFQNVFIAQKEALLGLRSDIARQKERLADDIKHFARFDDLNTVDNQLACGTACIEPRKYSWKINMPFTISWPKFFLKYINLSYGRPSIHTYRECRVLKHKTVFICKNKR